MTTDEIKRFITDYTNDVWNDHSVEAMDKYYSTDYVHRDVSGPDVCTLTDQRPWQTTNSAVKLPDMLMTRNPGVAKYYTWRKGRLFRHQELMRTMF